MAIIPNLQQELDAVRAENEALKARLAAAAMPRAMTMKVSEKGAVSIYGLGRFPITLYRGQIERILDNAVTIRAFIQANAAQLSVKG
jgi:hypothetical protein